MFYLPQGFRARPFLLAPLLAWESLFLFLIPYPLRFVLDGVLAPGSWKAPDFLPGDLGTFLSASSPTLVLAAAAAALIAFTLAQSAGTLGTNLGYNWLGETAAHRLRTSFLKSVGRMDFRDYQKRESGDLIQRGTSDVETLRKFWAHDLPEIFRSGMITLVFVPLMFLLHPSLALWSLTLVPLILGFSLVSHLWIAQAFREMDEAEARLTGVIQENIQGVRVVKAFARQDREKEKFTAANQDFQDRTARVIDLMALYWGVAVALTIGQMALVLGMGLQEIRQGTLSVGTLVVFLTNEIQWLWPLRVMGRILANSGKAAVSRHRIQEILDLPPEDRLVDGVTPEVRGRLECRGLGVMRTPGSWALRDVNFTLEPGQTLGITGPSGSGKSTLALALVRLLEATEGGILLDDRDIREYRKDHLRRSVALLLQDSFLYSRSIRSNLKMPRPEVEEEVLQESARTSGFAQVVQEMELGYETLLGEKGVTLSGGQRQRLALTRTLLRESPVLILDDSLSAVDTRTDALVRKALASRRHRCTTLLIAHRLTTLQDADLILVLDQGLVAEKGTHRELVAAGGAYARLWDLQSRKEV